MENLKQIIEKHAAWLRDEEGGEFANLSRADLSRANLSRANLTGANLTGANLTGANLYDADLSRANLSRANLTGANLTGANLSRADLSRADLTGADLREADLRGADLSEAKQVIIQIIASRHQVVSIDDDVKVGCKRNPLAWWMENYEEVGKAENYTPAQIEEYGLILSHIESVLKIRKP